MIHDERIETMRDNYDDHGAELVAKDAEIERLRRENEQLRNPGVWPRSAIEERAELIDENTRLRADNDALDAEAAKAINGLRDARREIEQLRGLLHEGLGEHVRLHVHPHFPAWEKRVREALGDAPDQRD